ncbi:MAG: tetratricopeptide repeat protein, partial [Brevundimonas sp.]|nr:tetratricopeptide repeat protein [Brevundimonas sp.]
MTSALSASPAAAPLPELRLADGIAGDAASPAALGNLDRRLAGSRAPGLKQQKKLITLMRSAVAAIRDHDYLAGSQWALKALQLDETNGLAWHILAISREKEGAVSQAIMAYEAALKLLPDELAIAADLGRLAQRLRQFEIAEKLFFKCLARSPGDIEVTNNLACVLRDQGRYGDAVEILKGILSIEPGQPLLWNTLGTVLSDQGEMAGSMVFFDEALRLDPGFSKARYNRANVRMALGEPRESLRDIDIALSQVDEPVEIDTMLLAKALTQLFVGDLEDGFKNYEARFSMNLEGAVQFSLDCPKMQVDDELRGKTLLVIGEQGLGDEVLFANALPDLVSELGPDGHLVLAVEPRLIPLMQRSFPDATVIAHKTVRHDGRLVRFVEQPAPAADGWLPIGSVFGRYRPSPGAFPQGETFLTPDPDRVEHWRKELASAGDGPKVGVVWKSLRLDGSRRRYFSPFDLWRPVLTTPGVVFVNLQYGDVTAELEAAKAEGLSLWTPPDIDLKDDLDDLAALNCALDLVLGPPNATSNIGAACGATWWALTTPDAWPRFGTDRYPAYPSTKIFPIEGFGAWDGAMERLRAALATWVEGASK